MKKIFAFLVAVMIVAGGAFSYGVVFGQGSGTSNGSISGYKNGLQASSQIGAGADKLGNNLQGTQGFYNGLSAGFMVGEEGNLTGTNLIFDDVENISEISSLLQLDLLQLLNQSNERSDTLRSYRDELSQQLSRVQERGDVLDKQINSLNDVLNTTQQRQDQLQNDVFNNIDAKRPLESEQSLNDFLTLKSKTGELSTKARILQRIRTKYQLAQTLLTNKIRFVTANQEALVKGVRVVDIKDPQIQLIVQP